MLISNMKTMYRNIQTFSFSNIDRFSTASLVTRMTTDVSNVQNAYQMILRICMRAPSSLIVATIMAISISARLSSVYLLAFVFLLLVFLFITKGGKLSQYEVLEKEAFETEYGVDGMVKERLPSHESINTKAMTTGVLMCVLGAVPLVMCSVLGMSSFIITSMVCLLLLLVATAVYLFVSVCGVNNSYKMLLQIGDYTNEMKSKNKKLDPLTRGYWMAMVVIYLSVSFLTGRWDRTWIIWAVSGVLFALIRIIAESFIKED